MRSVFKSKRRAFIYGAASGACEALFAVLGVFLAVYLRLLQTWLLAFSAGAMIYVVADELIPEAHDEIGMGTIGVTSGFALMMVLDMALG
jgi:ZIP family zinc transporter